ncbi:MAG: acyl-CoA dehydrogenase family protein [Acidimicrobiia bacterium]
MAWDFETEPEFEAKLEWIRQFVKDCIEPLDLMYPHRAYFPLDDEMHRYIDPMRAQIREQELWAPHLGPELGGKGYGQLKLALINEILGTSSWAPTIFGTAAPDTGNAEIIAHYGTPAQKDRYLQPLLNGECFSSYSMTEPQGGADPGVFTCRAEKDGDEWVINGYKFFSSNARTARFLIVMCVTNPDVPIYKGMSMFLVPTDTPGVDVERHVGLAWEGPDEGMHALIHYNNCRVPADALLGGEGQAFQVAQTRLGGGRVHHAMRTVGQCQKALDMMCERALSRTTKGSLLADKQLVQRDIAECYADLTQFRLLVLYTAWQIDRYKDYARVRKDIAVIKFLTPTVLEKVIFKAMHLHGALGTTNEMPFGQMWMGVPTMATVDGPSEVHMITAAKEVLKGYKAAPGMWPTAWLPAKRDEARQKLENYIEHVVGNL